MSENNPILSVENIYSAYDKTTVLRDVSLEVHNNEVVGLLGRNGAGKTTTLRTIAGVIKPHKGTIRFNGEDITDVPDYEISTAGISFVPEERAVFPDLTVYDNLRMGSIKSTENIMSIPEVLEWMPRLDERSSLKADKLSGGEQQMLAIGRALTSKTELLLLDEPTEGLAPKIVSDVIANIKEIKSRNIPILLVEQNLNTILEVADRVYILDQGQIVYQGTVDEIAEDTRTQQEYLGVGTESSK